MSERAQPQTEELKQHGDELANALKPANTSTTEQQKQQPAPSGTDPKE